MTIKREEALEAAVKCLSAKMRNRLEIVDRITGATYAPPVIDPEKCWIVRVHPEGLMLDGEEQYIVIDKASGKMTEVTTS